MTVYLVVSLPNFTVYTPYIYGSSQHYVYDRMYGNFPAKITVSTPYVPIHVWFWPNLTVMALSNIPLQWFCLIYLYMYGSGQT